MRNVEEIGKTYHGAFEKAVPSVERLQRAVLASVMAMYPNREELAVTADFLRDELGVDVIQVNVILPTKQLTIVSCPDKATWIKEVPLEYGLCVFTASTNETMHLNDIRNSDFTQAHFAKDIWGSWASAPVRLYSQPVGTVCALDGDAREWTQEEEILLESTARIIETQVTDWLKSRKDATNDGTDKQEA